MNALIVGCGYIGQRLARRLVENGAEVNGLVRSDASVAALKAQGITPLQADLQQPSSLQALPRVFDAATLYYFAPPPPQGQSDPRLKHFLHSLEHSGQTPAKLILISTTGVYGDCQGAWITEQQPLNPQVDRAHRRVDAERQLRTWADARGLPWVILRVPGIYGPGRLPVQRLQKRLPVLAEAESPYSNRIHADDLVSACLAAATADKRGVFHLSDGRPSTMTDYFCRVAAALKLPFPPVISRAEAERQLSPEMLGYLAESKRLDIRRMREELGVEPQYADLDSGLRQCLAE